METSRAKKKLALDTENKLEARERPKAIRYKTHVARI